MVHALLIAALVLPPITEAEALRFHESGLCQMQEPGRGLTRGDGEGWVATSSIGLHTFRSTAGRVRVGENAWKLGAPASNTADMVPGQPVLIKAPAGGELTWCLQFHKQGREECGPVPRAFLYDAQRVSDRPLVR